MFVCFIKCEVFSPQMFTAITKLVLKTKKEQQQRIQQQQTNDTVKLRSGSHGRKLKCC